MGGNGKDLMECKDGMDAECMYRVVSYVDVWNAMNRMAGGMKDRRGGWHGGMDRARFPSSLPVTFHQSS